MSAHCQAPCLYVFTDGSGRACGVGACVRLVPTLSDPRETSGPRIDRIPPTRPPASVASRAPRPRNAAAVEQRAGLARRRRRRDAARSGSLRGLEPGRLFGRGAGRHRARRRGPFLLSIWHFHSSILPAGCPPRPPVARSRRDMIESARAAAHARASPSPQSPAPIRLPIRRGLLRDDAYAGARPRPPRSAWAAALWQESRALAQPRAADAVRQE